MLAVLGLCFRVAASASGEPAALIFFEGGGPEADCCSLLNSNFLLAGGCKKTTTVHKPLKHPDGVHSLVDRSDFWSHLSFPWPRGWQYSGQVTSLSQVQHRKTNNPIDLSPQCLSLVGESRNTQRKSIQVWGEQPRFIAVIIVFILSPLLST